MKNMQKLNSIDSQNVSDTQRQDVSPENRLDLAYNMKQHSFKLPQSYSQITESNQVNGTQNKKMSKSKQSISFIKSQPKTIEDDDLIQLEDDSILSQSSEDEKCPKENNLNKISFKIPKQKSDLDWTNKLQQQNNYQIIIKSTFEEDALEKMGKQDSDLDNIPLHQHLNTRADSNQSSDQDNHTPGQRKWSKVRNVLKGVQLFSQLEVETISKPSDIDAHLSSSSRSNSPNRDLSPENRKIEEEQNASAMLKNLQLEAKQNAVREQWKLIDDFKYRKKFFQAIETGSPEDIQYIEEYLKDDPKRYLIVEESSERRMNKADSFGQTPLYCAAKNGNLEVIKILAKYKANHKLITYLNNDQSASDTAINVAARWGHVKVVEYLLDTFLWDKNDLKTASKSATNKEIKKLISKKQ
ncbi:ankyrin repeat protein (macronuclear) [Tetrahymena thermophila SB210]|uniref:Ankyrin repeat protein n=1 Tax=Tetrahymena thermophila (strain SB210) TaxID=312017 RepID=Q22WJ4_TETTS|nr:ankyrin repeat protein [Tetrahymena thermophila SB210]EAR89423.2 ankyrin repeat protein [Tetrahymena thermophila SB210]|eukprot:XP_001009668.2 ankyrin repeat protein [Tetrahymena thermophila SB210]